MLPDKNIYGGLLPAALLLCVCSHAQSAADTVRVLQKVQVTTKLPQRDITPVQRMNAQTLEQLSSQSVADAIRYFSGVQLKDYGGIGGLKTVNIRSMGTNHTGVFYDGIQLGNAQNGQVDLGKFSLDNVEEVNLYNGQKAEIFQPAKDFGSAGSIYLQSARPVFKGDKKDNLRLTFKTGSFGLINPGITWQRKISSKVNGHISTEWTHANGRYRFRYKKHNSDGSIAYDTTAIRENGDVNAVRLEGGLDGKTEKTEWKWKTYSYISERGLPGYIANNVFKHGQRQWDSNLFTQGWYRRKVTKRYNLLLSGKLAYDYTRYLDTDTANMYTDNRYKQTELYLSAANEYTIAGSWKLALSADYQWNKLNANLVDFAYPVRHTGLLAAATSWRINGFAVQGSLLGTVVKDLVRVRDAAPVKTVYTPAVFLSWQPFGKTDVTLRSFYKKIFRMPTFNDLYYTFIGNSLLKPEYATQYDVGATWSRTAEGKLLKQASIQVDAYYNSVTDKIVAVPTSNPFRWMMMNLGKVEIRGLDVAAQADWRLSALASVNTRLTYTFQQAQDFTDATDAFYGNQIPYIPRHSFSAIATAGYKQWSLNYSFIYTGERYDQKANILKNYLQPWYTTDVSISRYADIAGGRWRVAIDVNNVFNQYYDVVLNYPMPGRNYKLVVQVNL